MTVQARCLLCYPNYLLPQVSASTTATVSTQAPVFSNGTWLSALPLSNLSLDKLYLPARSTAATNASTKFDVDFGEPRWIGAVALIRHNLTPGTTPGTAKVKVSVSTVSNFASTLNTPAFANAYQVSRAAGSLPNGWALDTTNVPTQEELQHYRSLASVFVLDQNYFGRYLRVEIDDTTNTAGYVELGGVFAGPWFQPDMDYDPKPAIKWNDMTTVVTGPGGVRFYDTQARYRTAEFSFGSMLRDQALEFPFEMEGRMGTSGTMLFVMDPTSGNHLHRWSFLATLQELSGLEWPYVNPAVASKAVKLIEKL